MGIAVHRSTVPPHVQAVVHKALERLPADRFGTAGDLKEALSRTEFRWPVEENGPASDRGSRSRERVLGATTLVLALAIGALWLNRPTPDVAMVDSASVAEARIAPDHRSPEQAAETADEILGQPIAEILKILWLTPDAER